MPNADFTAHMNWIEREHTFPSDPAQFHSKRFRHMLSNSPLAEQLGSIPGIVGAGSCGKASTLSFLARIFSALGLKCAVGVKPPLSESPFGNLERYQIWEGCARSRRMTPDEFEQLFPALRQAAENTEADHPEWGAAAPYDMRAYLLDSFAIAQNTDLLISEANIGRKRDPISALPNTVLTAITPIGTDHGGLLVAPEGFHPELGPQAGPFFDKAEGLRLGKAVIFGRQDEKVQRLLDPESVWQGRDYRATDCQSTIAGSEFHIQLSEELAGYLRVDAAKLRKYAFYLQALGKFQCENAAQALVGALLLRRRAQTLGDDASDPLQGFASAKLVRLLQTLSLEEFLHQAGRGLKAAMVPGRLQLTSPNCVEAVASSPEKLQALLDSLASLLQPGQRVCICATFLNRIHYLRQAVELLANWPLNAFMAVTKYLNDDVNCDAAPEDLAAYCPQAHLISDAAAAQTLVLERAQQNGDLALFLGNGMLSYLHRS
ncbi:MAG: hypothetical protein Q4F00_09575 [bacterium]|nr:hypothetical protein [bacterium]